MLVSVGLKRYSAIREGMGADAGSLQRSCVHMCVCNLLSVL